MSMIENPNSQLYVTKPEILKIIENLHSGYDYGTDYSGETVKPMWDDNKYVTWLRNTVQPEDLISGLANMLIGKKPRKSRAERYAEEYPEEFANTLAGYYGGESGRGIGDLIMLIDKIQNSAYDKKKKYEEHRYGLKGYGQKT